MSLSHPTPLTRIQSRGTMRSILSPSATPVLTSAVDSLLSTPMRSSLTIAAFAIGTAALAAVLLLSDALADLSRRQLASSGAAHIQVRTVDSYWLDGIAFRYRDPAPTIPLALAVRLANRVSTRATVLIIDSTAIEANIGNQLRGIAVISKRNIGDSSEDQTPQDSQATISKRLHALLVREFGSKGADSVRLGSETVAIRGLEPSEQSGTALAIYVSQEVLRRLSNSPTTRTIIVVPRLQEIDDEYKAILRDVTQEVRRDSSLDGRAEVDTRGPAQFGRVSTAVTVFRLSFAALAVLCIIVAGLGAANVVLLATIQRAREIGIRRSVGASQAAIRAQFATEAILMATAGGALGLLLGWLFIEGVATVIEARSAIQLTVKYTAFAAIVPMLSSVSIGLIAASFPAARAARINPVVALREE